MKKQILMLLFLVVTTWSAAWTGVKVNKKNFPNKLFRNWVLQKSYGSDCVLTDEEIAGVIEIKNGFKLIKTIKGIEHFTALTELWCSDNLLTSLDVSQNTALKILSCYQNKLTSLDVSKNTALLELHCYFNQLTSLDVSKNTALLELHCYSNQLTSLDVSKNIALTTLYCGCNQLTSLDVSRNIALTTLDVSDYYPYGLRIHTNGNQLTTLDVSQNTKLTTLNCNGNQLTSLDVSQNTALTTLCCGRNQLTSLDVSKNTALTKLECYQNKISGTAMDALIESLPIVNKGIMHVIYNENEQNVMTKKQVAAAKVKGWKPYACIGIGQFGYIWEEYAGSEQ